MVVSFLLLLFAFFNLAKIKLMLNKPIPIVSFEDILTST